MSKYFNSIVVGIDVASEFSIASALDKEGNVILSNYRITHNLDSFNMFLDVILKISHGQNLVFALESTGVYHMTLTNFLESCNQEVLVINPLITNSNKNNNIRKVKNDKKDSLAIAKLIKFQDVKFSSIIDKDFLELRSLVREYYSFVDSRAKFKIKLITTLVTHWPGFDKVFYDTCGKAPLLILSKYPSPSSFLKARKSSVIKVLLASNKGIDWAEDKYSVLHNSSKDALVISNNINQTTIINSILNTIDSFSSSIELIKKSIDEFILLKENTQLATDIKLIESIPGCGTVTAATIVSEISGFDRFKKPKHLIAFFGLDPAVRESGKFKADNVNISKRGSRSARRALFTLALASIRNGNNPVLRDYYDSKCLSKVKMVALTNVMHKLVKIIFAVLRNQKDFELRTNEEHISEYLIAS
ncbi:MAG: hypothetical protein A2Y22_08185 [Clostridiales bacterium GWD2_32_59]|nr:MAG: hypothetical protein A2Y22_08185 [Clostridiales bacterium GWD2_32_59]